MARERRSKSAAADRRRPQKKKVSILNTESIDWIDYKDVNLLRRFMSERAKIRARRVTGNSAQQQREVAKAIRIAREMALLPYSVRQVTQRKGGRRERGDRDDRPLRDRDDRPPRDRDDRPPRDRDDRPPRDSAAPPPPPGAPDGAGAGAPDAVAPISAAAPDAGVEGESS
jgi:small subunit ribosomal protein S18